MRKILGLALFGTMLASGYAFAQDLTVMGSGAFSEPYKLLAPQYEKKTNEHLTFVPGPSMGTAPTAIPMRLARKEPADVIILARTELDKLTAQGLVVNGSQVDLVRSQIAMAVKAGAAVPDISTVDKLKQVLLQAKSIAVSDSASGVYLTTELFPTWGLEKELTPKIQRVVGGRPVGEALAAGESQVGFQQMSELKPIKGITIVGLIPQQVQKTTIFSAGIVSSSQHKDDAKKLIQFLSAPQQCGTIREAALDPIACSK